MYSTLVLPYFDYCSEDWNRGCGKTLSSKLQKLQNRAARVITFSNYDKRSAELLNELKWDNLETRRWKQITVMMQKIMNNHAPSYLVYIFEHVTAVHTHNLRNSAYNVYIPQPQTEAGKIACITRGRFSGIVYHMIRKDKIVSDHSKSI